jgi:hypothetical protein
MIVAGEASGDLHGSRVVQAIMRLNPEIQVFAMGSEHLRKAGAEIIIDSSRLAVVGITEVFEHIRGLFRAYQNLKEFIKNNKLSLAILIDFPDFNLFLARVAKKAGVPVLYYISPQVWAWRSGRVQKIVRRVNKMAVIFPFEVPIYQKAGLDVEFVGHPLLDVLGLNPQEGLSSNPSEFRGDPGKGDSVFPARDGPGRRNINCKETRVEIHFTSGSDGECSGAEKSLTIPGCLHLSRRRQNLRGHHGRRCGHCGLRYGYFGDCHFGKTHGNRLSGFPLELLARKSVAESRLGWVGKYCRREKCCA